MGVGLKLYDFKAAAVIARNAGLYVSEKTVDGEIILVAVREELVDEVERMLEKASL